MAAAYAAFRYLSAKTDEERAHYDWMGYIGNFVAICAFLPLPFAGYYLASEIYAYSQALGIQMMGGVKQNATANAIVQGTGGDAVRTQA